MATVKVKHVSPYVQTCFNLDDSLRSDPGRGRWGTHQTDHCYMSTQDYHVTSGHSSSGHITRFLKNSQPFSVSVNSASELTTNTCY